MIDFKEDSPDEDKIDFQLDFQPEESSVGDKALGALDAAAAMFAGSPAQIAGGLYGLSTFLSGQGLDKSVENMEKVQKSNFGFGEYTPRTKKGKEYSETVGAALEKPVEVAGDLGERIAGNEGRLAGELWTRSAMELIDPTVIAGVGAKAITGRKPKAKPNEKALQKLDEAPTTKIDFVEETAKPYSERTGDLTEQHQQLANVHDQDILGKLKDIDQNLETARVDEYIRAKEAQQAIEARNAQIEQEVTQRATLEMQAAERARQEQAPVLPNHDAEIAGPKVMEQTQQRLAAGERDAYAMRQQAQLDQQGTIYVDPQDQAFRGDPNSPEAVQALENQTLAMELELEHLRGKGTPIGEPLRPLTDVTKPITSTGRMSRQRGGVTTDLLTLGLFKNNPVVKAMKKQGDGTFIPDDLTPEQLNNKLETARGETDGKSLKYMDSGAALTAMKRGSTAIKLAGDLVNNAFKRADLAIREHVFPVEQSIKGLSRSDMMTLGEIMKKEMFRGEKFTSDQLAAFNPKLLTSYKKMRDMFDDSLRIQNEARAAKGQAPITAAEAYLSSRWNGDFRRPLYNKDGKVVWYLAADSKAGLNAQTRAVLKDFPDLTYDPNKDHTVRFWNRKTDLESAYSTMVDILGRNDPSVDTIRQYMEDQTVGRGATFLNQEKHFKKKGNVRGFIGDRPSLTVNDYFDRHIPFGDSVTVGKGQKGEVLAMLQQQMQYAKNAYRWSELQKAGQSLKTIINDPTLVEQQPNNVKYIREYFKHAIGYGESRATRAISDSLRDAGVSPAPFDKAVGGLKSFFILQKLAGNVGKLTADTIQLTMTVPHLVNLMKLGVVGNLPKAIAAGLLGGITMGTGHVAGYLGKKPHDIPGFDFYNRAQKYAEDNGVTARSIYDESPIENAFSATGKVADLAGKTMTIPETYVRSMAFMTYAQYLKDSGKFKNEVDIFREAERLANVSMVDYSPTERPMIFGKLGTAGNFLNTLQTYSFNFFNQYSYFMREAAKGNPMPLFTAIAMQYMVAGAMGIPGFEDINDLWMHMKDALPAKQWKKLQDSDFLSNPKLWMLQHMGESSVYGWLSDKTGVGITSRVAAPTAGQMAQSPLGPITDIGKQVGAVAGAVADPTNTTKLAQAAMQVAPVGIQGALETAPFMEGITHNQRMVDGKPQNVYMRPSKLMEREALTTRTPEEETLRKFGLRSQREVVERDVNYSTKRASATAREKSRTLPEAFYDALRRGDKQDAKEYYETYVSLTGNKLSKDQIINQAKEEFLTDIERQKISAKKSVQTMVNLKRMEEIFDSIEKENQ